VTELSLTTFRLLADYAVGIWTTLLVVSFLSSIVVGIIQQWRGNESWDTRAMPALAFLHYARALPIVLPILFVGWSFTGVITAIGYLIAGAFWLWHRILGKVRSAR
jgi:hypothetical protein